MVHTDEDATQWQEPALLSRLSRRLGRMAYAVCGACVCWEVGCQGKFGVALTHLLEHKCKRQGQREQWFFALRFAVVHSMMGGIRKAFTFH